MTVTNGYLTAEQAAQYVGRQFADATDILDAVVTSVSRMIDRYCGRHFYQAGTVDTPVARIFDADEPCELDLGCYNDLVSVTSLKADTDGSGTYDYTYSASDYQLCPVGAATRAPIAEPYTEIELLASAPVFPLYAANRREGLIQVTGIWGWPSVPDEVTQAARLLVAEMDKLKDAPFGTVGNDVTGFFRAPAQMPARARQLLQPYVHPDHVGIG